VSFLKAAANPARGDLSIDRPPLVEDPFCFSSARRQAWVQKNVRFFAAPMKNKKENIIRAYSINRSPLTGLEVTKTAEGSGESGHFLSVFCTSQDACKVQCRPAQQGEIAPSPPARAHQVHCRRRGNESLTPNTQYAINHAPRTPHHPAPRITRHASRATHHAPRITHHAPRTTHHAPGTTHQAHKYELAHNPRTGRPLRPASVKLKRCMFPMPPCLPGRSNLCEKTGLGVGRCARRCGRRNSRAGPEAGLPAVVRCDRNRRKRAPC
jgi:hypothetical protein